MSERSVSAPVLGAVRRWSLATLYGCLLAWIAITVLDAGWAAGPTDGFLVGVAGVLSVEFGLLWWLLSPTDATSEPQTITLATWVTIGRGVPLALLAGFLFVSPPTGLVAWVPGILFAVATLSDVVDGFIARATDSVTELGGRLDVEIDSLVIFVGAMIGIVYDSAPPALLVFGTAHYLFTAGCCLRRWLGYPVYELGDSQFRRVVGGLTMVTIWIVILPVGSGSGQVLANVLLVPYLVSFVRDWFAISGQLE
jgi:CDP-diacylglycerol--glycerol-3-phosphate 3-phosphatidyltransferase